jgi:hypothetical protein
MIDVVESVSAVVGSSYTIRFILFSVYEGIRTNNTRKDLQTPFHFLILLLGPLPGKQHFSLFSFSTIVAIILFATVGPSLIASCTVDGKPQQR